MANELRMPKGVASTHNFCPGCGHGIIQKVIFNVLEELGIFDDAVVANGVGCTCNTGLYADWDWVQAPHGRAAAVAQGMKAVSPERIVLTYQGDGDAGAIGLAETMYAAKRNAPITVFFINNGVFGMTGGQTAPTSLEGQVTVTAQSGVDYVDFGKPLHLAELLASFDVGYIARGSIANIKELNKTRGYIKKALQCQMEGKGYAFVEILAPCPINWKMEPSEAMERLENVSMKEFNCGELKGLGE